MTKNKIKSIATTLLLSGAVVLTSCSDDDTTNINKEGGYTFQKPAPVAEVINEASLFSNLNEALKITGLASAVSGSGPYTVFAPSNDAFKTLLGHNVHWKSVSDIPKNALTEIVKYHVINGKQLNANQISEGDELTMVNNKKATVSLDVKKNLYLSTSYREKDTSFVVSPNILATNGVIHMLDNVMLVEDVIKDAVDVASETADLSKLVEAVQHAELVDALKKDGDHTIFAPNNAAFQALLDSNTSWNAITDIPKADLKNILLFHVLKGKTVVKDSLKAGYINTLGEGANEKKLSLQIATEGGVKFNNESSPVTTDVLVSNGIVHVVDKVMMPKNVVGLASANKKFSSLVEALTDSRLGTDYTNLLSGTGPFTVFAPTNEAFTALLASNTAWNAISDIPEATLRAVLDYHVLANANVQASELKDGQEITMAGAGAKITVDLSDGAKLKTVGNTEAVKISSTDLQGTNGVIHGVDAVLLPTTN